MQIAAAVCADKQAGEHIVFSVAGTAFAHLSTLLLYLLKHGTFNNGFVNILEHHPIFRVVMNPLLVLVGLGVGFEVQNITTILLLVQKMGNRGAIPLGGGARLAPSGTADAFLNPVACGVRMPSFSNWVAICSVPKPSNVISKMRRTTCAASSSMTQCLGLFGSLIYP